MAVRPATPNETELSHRWRWRAQQYTKNCFIKSNLVIAMASGWLQRLVRRFWRTAIGYYDGYETWKKIKKSREEARRSGCRKDDVGDRGPNWNHYINKT